jgi:hypothetical protein
MNWFGDMQSFGQFNQHTHSHTKTTPHAPHGQTLTPFGSQICYQKSTEQPKATSALPPMALSLVEHVTTTVTCSIIFQSVIRSMITYSFDGPGESCRLTTKLGGAAVSNHAAAAAAATAAEAEGGGVKAAAVFRRRTKSNTPVDCRWER